MGVNEGSIIPREGCISFSSVSGVTVGGIKAGDFDGIGYAARLRPVATWNCATAQNRMAKVNHNFIMAPMVLVRRIYGALRSITISRYLRLTAFAKRLVPTYRFTEMKCLGHAGLIRKSNEIGDV